MSNAKPMSPGRREGIYQHVNGTTFMSRGRLTPKQRRRIEHKRNHAAAPFGKRAGS